jgi:hypothetical protein
MSDYEPKDFLEAVNLLREARDLIRRQDKQRIELMEHIERQANEIGLIRWMVRGIAAARAHVSITLNAAITAKELPRSFELLGENCAHVLLRQANIVFKDHARIYTLRNYVRYLQGQCDHYGVKYSALDRDNDHDDGKDIFSPTWEPSQYLAPEVLKSIEEKP